MFTAIVSADIGKRTYNLDLPYMAGANHPSVPSIKKLLCVLDPQRNYLYRGPTELVQHFAYRGSSHRRMGAVNKLWLYRSPIPVGRRGAIYLFK
jgi:hypothetical protein